MDAVESGDPLAHFSVLKQQEQTTISHRNVLLGRSAGRSNSVMSHRNRNQGGQYITMIGRQGKTSSIGYNTQTKQIFVNLASIKNGRNKPFASSAQRMQSNSPARGSLNFINRKNELKKQIDENIRMLKKIHYVKPSVQAKELQKHAQRS